MAPVRLDRVLPLAAISALLAGCGPAAPDVGAARDVIVQFTKAVAASDNDAARALLVAAERTQPRRKFGSEGLSDGYEVGPATARDGAAAQVVVSPKGAGKPVTFVLLPEVDGWRVSLGASMQATLGREIGSLQKMLDDAGQQMAERMQGIAPPHDPRRNPLPDLPPTPR
jgi:hypothetical protein